MTRTIVDQATVAKLMRGQQPTEVCDESGRVVGYFQPIVNRALYRGVEVPFSEDELDRFEREPGGRPLAQILTDLKRNS